MKWSTAAGVALVILFAAVGTAALVTYTADDYLTGQNLSVELNATDTETLVAIGHEGGDTLTASNTGALRITVTEMADENQTIVVRRRIEPSDETFPFADGDVTHIYAPAAEPGMRVAVVWIGPTERAGERTLLDTTL